MGSLRELDLRSVYRSETDDILRDFYVPALSVASQYDRAVGYFSASMLTYAAQGLSSFVEGDGRMRLVVGAWMEQDEIEAAQAAYEQRRLLDSLGSQFVDGLQGISESLFFRRLELLSWLIASGRLEIRAAVRRRGMYHEKIGMIADQQGDSVVFSGSANETTAALLPDFNFESINVFPSWRPEFAGHFQPYVDGFERLWNNESPGTLVLPFPDAARRYLLNSVSGSPKLLKPQQELALADDELEPAAQAATPRIPDMIDGREFDLRPHQRKALAEWKANDFSGIMPLATGAGKTITAIYGAVRIYEQARRLAVVISVPYTVLADQWCDVLREFNIYAIRAYHSSSSWQEELRDFVDHYRAGATDFGCIVVVNRTFGTNEGLREQLSKLPEESLLWIGDECHHHGGESIAEKLPENASFRLGLSATPLSEFDEDFNDRLRSYYGSLLEPYSIENALEDGVLTPYDYEPIEVTLTPDETDRYIELSREIGRLSAGASDSAARRDNPALQMKLFERARLIAGCANKLVVLRQHLAAQPPSRLTLFYCGDGTTEDDLSGEERRQIELVVDALRETGWRCSPYTSREKRRDRSAMMRLFAAGSLDALVAIRCLDEGVDIPACRTAYLLASSRTQRQGVQRRGRVLRRAHGKPYARIFDFVVTPGVDSDQTRSLVRSELERAVEFARLARNSSAAQNTILEIAVRYGVSEVLETER